MRIKQIALITLPVLLILFYYRNLIANVATHMTGWYDGPFVIWVFQNNIKHFASLDFRHLFETNAMYPFTDTLSFTEHMFFPSLIAFLISLINKNPVFQFNLITILNHILIYLSFYLLSSRFSKNTGTRVMASFFAAFSPFIFSQIGHLQMIMVWPFYMSLYFLLHPARRLRHIILSGLFLGIQFHSAVYLGLMGFFAILLYETVTAFTQKSYIQKAKEFAVIFVTFLVVSMPSLYGYLKMQANYHPYRGQEEYVNYSAHITDYLLVASNDSFFNRYIFSKSIGALNRHLRGEMAAFIGFIPFAVILFWFLNKKKWKIDKANDSKAENTKVWLLLLIIAGVLFSIGPRANFNGKYLVFPLPYYFLLKLVPAAGIMRALARWYFVVHFAVNVLFIYAADFISSRLRTIGMKTVFAASLFILMLIEFYPFPAQATARDWKAPSYLYLQQACKNKPGAVLIFPFEYRNKAEDIGKYLSLKTNQLMSSTLYDCPTLSGFSSFEPPLFQKWQKDFDANGITDKNIKILVDNKFAFVKVNLDGLSEEEKVNPESVIHTKSLRKVFRDTNYIIYRIID